MEFANEGLLGSACRPINKWHGEHAALLAAAYAFGARPKSSVRRRQQAEWRSQSVIMFLRKNGVDFAPDQATRALALAAGEVDEERLARWRIGTALSPMRCIFSSFQPTAMAKSPMTDREQNRFSARAARYARVGANVGGVAARIAGARLFGITLDRGRNAIELAAALGGLKGPIMKVAQLMATIPDALPPEYAAELTKLQSQAPPMGWAFVKRRMKAELGPDWQQKFESFEHHPAAAASLGQVHRARAHDGEALACKLQYADMQSAVEADLVQLDWIFAIHRRMDPVIDTTEIAKEIGARIREELDYRREAKHVALYRAMLGRHDLIRVPRPWPELSTGRLLTLDWLEGRRLLEHKDDRARGPQPARDRDVHRLVVPVQPLRRDPRRPASRQLHGVRGRPASRPASTCSTTAASASSRRNSSAAWSISITGCCTATTTSSCTPTRPGASSGSRAN